MLCLPGTSLLYTKFIRPVTIKYWTIHISHKNMLIYDTKYKVSEYVFERYPCHGCITFTMNSFIYYWFLTIIDKYIHAHPYCWNYCFIHYDYKLCKRCTITEIIYRTSNIYVIQIPCMQQLRTFNRLCSNIITIIRTK